MLSGFCTRNPTNPPDLLHFFSKISEYPYLEQRVHPLVLLNYAKIY